MDGIGGGAAKGTGGGTAYCDRGAGFERGIERGDGGEETLSGRAEISAAGVATDGIKSGGGGDHGFAPTADSVA